MKSKFIFGLVLATAVFFGYGFQNINSKITDNSYQPVTSKDLKITGSELFNKNCATCHGVNRQGNPPTFPSLVNIDKKLSKSQIAQLLKTGRNIMPNFSHLSDSERNALVGYLYGESTFADMTTVVTSAENGRNLFVANCAKCHQPDAKNLNIQNQNQMQMGMHMGMKPPVLNGVNKWVNIYQFKQILNMGPCYMPSFYQMKDKDKEDIYIYLSSLENVYQNANYSMKRGCGMGMRN
jgi:mono/diheme cytochrome c family protein